MCYNQVNQVSAFLSYNLVHEVLKFTKNEKNGGYLGAHWEFQSNNVQILQPLHGHLLKCQYKVKKHAVNQTQFYNATFNYYES